MAQPDKSTFLGKLARFVSNPTTDWTALDNAPTQIPDSGVDADAPELTQAELLTRRHQRRKRNRNIRVKEFAMLRQVRAGASIPGVQNDPSGTSDSDTVPTNPEPYRVTASRPTGVAGFDVNQIDHIERQMVEQWWDKSDGAPAEPMQPAVADAAPKTQMLIETQIAPEAPGASNSNDVIAFDPAFFDPPPAAKQEAEFRPMRESAAANGTGEQVDFSAAQQPGNEATFVYESPATEFVEDFLDNDIKVPGTSSADAPLMEFAPVPLPEDEAQTLVEADLVQAELRSATSSLAEAAIPSQYDVHDLPESLNEPAILYAQGRTEQVEEHLLKLAKHEQAGSRKQGAHAEPHVLLALLDFYRSTRQEDKFETACIDMVQHFDRSAPQYRGADLGEASRILSTMASRVDFDGLSKGNWLSPEELDLTDVMMLRSQLMENPAQVLLDWRGLDLILEDAVEPLLDQFRDLASRKIDLLMWGSEHLLELCKEQIEVANGRGPTTHVLLWLLRLELVRIMHGQEAFDADALEYCIALEESPPSWVRTRCNYIDADNAISLLDSLEDDAEAPADLDQSKSIAQNLKHPLQWQGSLQGSLKELLQAVDEACGMQHCSIDCKQLDSMDYSAAADLLRWLMQHESSQRQIRFVHVNRLLAVFWRIMGITAKATVELRRD